jgi:hypothetical protein
MNVNCVTPNILLKEMNSPKNDIYITFFAMSIKNVRKFTYNLFKIQYVIIFNNWLCHTKNITVFTGSYLTLCCNMQHNVRDAAEFFKVFIFVYFFQT